MYKDYSDNNFFKNTQSAMQSCVQFAMTPIPQPQHNHTLGSCQPPRTSATEAFLRFVLMLCCEFRAFLRRKLFGSAQ